MCTHRRAPIAARPPLRSGCWWDLHRRPRGGPVCGAQTRTAARKQHGRSQRPPYCRPGMAVRHRPSRRAATRRRPQGRRTPRPRQRELCRRSPSSMRPSPTLPPPPAPCPHLPLPQLYRPLPGDCVPGSDQWGATVSGFPGGAGPRNALLALLRCTGLHVTKVLHIQQTQYVVAPDVHAPSPKLVAARSAAAPPFLPGHARGGAAEAGWHQRGATAWVRRSLTLPGCGCPPPPPSPQEWPGHRRRQPPVGVRLCVAVEDSGCR